MLSLRDRETAKTWLRTWRNLQVSIPGPWGVRPFVSMWPYTYVKWAIVAWLREILHLRGFMKSYIKVRLFLSTFPLFQNNKYHKIINYNYKRPVMDWEPERWLCLTSLKMYIVYLKRQWLQYKRSLLFNLQCWQSPLEIFCSAKNDYMKGLCCLIWRLVENHYIQKYPSHQLAVWCEISQFPWLKYVFSVFQCALFK